VSRLAANGTLGLAFGRRGRRGLDEVRRRRFGGGAGVFARAGQTLLQVHDGGTQRVNLPLQVPHLGSQTLAAGASRLLSHAAGIYSNHVRRATAVNRYSIPQVKTAS